MRGYVRKQAGAWAVVVKAAGCPRIFPGYTSEAEAREAVSLRCAEVRGARRRRSPRLVTCEYCGRQFPVSQMSGDRDSGYVCETQLCMEARS